MKQLILTLTLIGSALYSQIIQAQNIHPDYIDGAIFLKIKDHSGIVLPAPEKLHQQKGLWQMARLAKEYGIDDIRLAFPKIRTLTFEKTYKIHFSNSSQAENLLRDLGKLPYVEYAEKIPLQRAVYTPNDPNQSSQWFLNNIDAFLAWNLHTGGNAVVAIVDDAVKITHEDLAPNLWVNTGETPNDGIDNDGNGYIDDINGWDAADDDNNPNPPSSASSSNFTHGTHCAGIAAGATDNGLGGASIGFNTKLMAVKCTYDTASNTNIIYTGYEGVQYAMAAGADVISMSWGGPGYSVTIENLMTTAYNQGIVLVGAAGNDNSSTTFYPAGYNHVIAVASTSQSDAKSSFSNYGNWVTISAPGSSIFSTLAGSNSSYGNQSGTSMAAPMVAGLCALMKSYNPSATPATITSCLTNTADNIDTQNPGFTGQLGAGRINANGALQCVNPNVPPVAAFTQSGTSGCPGVQISFTDQSSNLPSSWQWSVPGATPASSTSQNPTFTFPSAGIYTVTLVATNGFGSDTLKKINLITVFGNGVPLPFTEDFESGSFVTNGWTQENPDNSFTWEIASTGGNSPGSKSAKLDFYNYSSIGQRDAIHTPPLDFSGQNALQLTFDHAYRRYNTASSDSLIIYVSTDCGATFPNKIFAGAEDGTGSFATAATSTTPFTPSQTDEWCFGPVGASCFAVDLSAFAGSTNVVIRFEGYSNYQNNLFIDNINISGVSSNQPPVTDFSASITSGCVPLTVNFSDLSMGTVTGWNWSFPGGTPSASTSQNPSVTYSTPGTYAVTLSASNTFGTDTEVKSGYITINSCAPVACDSLSNWNNGTAILYTGSGFTGYVGGHNSYGDQAKAEYFANAGNASYLTAIEADFAVAVPDNPATSVLGFAVWHADGTANAPGTLLATKDILIADIVTDLQNNQPTTVVFDTPVSLAGAFYAGFFLSYAPNGAITDTVAVYTNTDQETTPATAWELWDNGTWYPYDDASSWGISVAHSIVAYTTDMLPVADFIAGSTQECQGASVSFTNNSTGASSFEWTFAGGNPYLSTDLSPVVTYDTTGVHDVVLRVSGGCYASDTKTVASQITITATPDITFTNLQNATCGQNNGSVTANASGGAGGYTFQWNTNPPQNGPTLNGLSFGSYTVTVTDVNGCSSEKTVLINDAAGPVASVNAWTNETCGESNGTATADVSGGTGPFLYSWNTSPPQSGTTATGLPANTYQVTITDANGCADSAFVTITGSPSVGVLATGNDPSCEENNGSAIANVTGGTTPFNYIWNNDPGLNTASIFNLDTGNYKVKVTDGSGCTDSSEVSIVNSGELPLASFSATDSLIGSTRVFTFTNTSNGSNGTTWFWDFGDGNTSADEHPAHTYQAGFGTFTVTLIMTNECGSDTAVVLYDILSSVSASFFADLSVYPNPGNGSFTVEIQDFREREVEISLYNMVGQQLHKERFRFTDGMLKAGFDFEHLPEGTYQLHISGKHSFAVKKLIISK